MNKCAGCGASSLNVNVRFCPGCGNYYCVDQTKADLSCMRKHLGVYFSCPTLGSTSNWSRHESTGLRSMALESLNILHENKAVRSGLTTLRTILLRVDDRQLSSNVVRGIVDAAHELTQDEQAAWQKYMKRVQDLLTERRDG